MRHIRPAALPLLLLLLLLLPLPLRADDDPSLARMREADGRARTAARALAAEIQLAPEVLGPDWRLPWQLPDGVSLRADSEDAYWGKVRLFPAAFDDALASAWLAMALPKAVERVAWWPPRTGDSRSSREATVRAPRRRCVPGSARPRCAPW